MAVCHRVNIKAPARKPGVAANELRRHPTDFDIHAQLDQLITNL
jgi:hypothetical protein